MEEFEAIGIVTRQPSRVKKGEDLPKERVRGESAGTLNSAYRVLVVRRRTAGCTSRVKVDPMSFAHRHTSRE